MKILIPTPITETSLIETSAGALTETSVEDNSYPLWLSGADYPKGQRYNYGDVIYESLHKIRGRTTTPDNDERFWKALGSTPTTDAWTSGAVVATGTRVYYDVTHRVYQALQDTDSGDTTTPDLDPENWLDVGPMNPWAMFDQSAGTRTSSTSPLQITLQPGIVAAIAVLGLVGATQVDIEMFDGETSVYTNSQSVGDSQILNDWYDYFFAEIIPRTDFVIDDLPPYGNATIVVTITGADTVGIGNLVVGTLSAIAPSNYGAQIGIVDYSKKETNDFGITAIVERAYARKIDVQMMIYNSKLDYVASKLAALRATPAVYFEEVGYQSMILYGFYRDWNVVISYPNNSLVSLSLEGMT